MDLTKLGVQLAAIVGACSTVLLPQTVRAQIQTVAVNVHTAGSNSNAAAGDSGATIKSSALVSVVVTRHDSGTPASNLGESVGTGTGQVSPAGWAFGTLVVPPGGCLMSTTAFANRGNGTYVFRVVPFLENASCAWVSGNYHYVVRINKIVTVDGVRALFKGSGLGVLTIP